MKRKFSRYLFFNVQVEFSAPPPDPSNPFLTVKYIPAVIPSRFDRYHNIFLSFKLTERDHPPKHEQPTNFVADNGEVKHGKGYAGIPKHYLDKFT